MISLPDPFTTPDVDLRDFDGFMMNVEKLLASELWAVSTGEEFKAAMGLWCRAWKQVPAGSLPNDERVLASFSGAGIRWKKVREIAIRGFVLCSDGRLYHTTLCEDANRAYAKKMERRERTKAATQARQAARNAERNVQRNDLPQTQRNDVPVDRDRDSIKEKEESNDSSKKTDAKRGTRIPEGDQLPTEWEAFAKQEGHPDPQREWLIFTDYWRSQPGQKGVKLDWFGTWRNWIRRTVGDGKRSSGNGRKPSSNGFIELLTTGDFEPDTR